MPKPLAYNLSFSAQILAGLGIVVTRENLGEAHSQTFPAPNPVRLPVSFLSAKTCELFVGHFERNLDGVAAHFAVFDVCLGSRDGQIQ